MDNEYKIGTIVRYQDFEEPAIMVVRGFEGNNLKTEIIVHGQVWSEDYKNVTVYAESEQLEVVCHPGDYITWGGGRIAAKYRDVVKNSLGYFFTYDGVLLDNPSGKFFHERDCSPMITPSWTTVHAVDIEPAAQKSIFKEVVVKEPNFGYHGVGSDGLWLINWLAGETITANIRSKDDIRKAAKILLEIADFIESEK